MARFRAAVPPNVADVIRHLHPDIKRAVRAAIDMVCANPAAGEALHDDLKGLMKVAVGRFRVVYRVDTSARTVKIEGVGRRRNIYEELAELVRQQK